MNNKGVTIVLLFFLLCSCNHSTHSVKDINCSTLEVPISQEDSSGIFNSFFKLKRLVVLETKDESMIRWISKIAFYNDNIFIMDRIEKKIFVFNENGNFLKSYHHYGQGPGEYISLADFTIKNDTLYLLDGLGARLLQYSLADSLLGVQNVDKAEGVYLFSDRKFALNKKLGVADRNSDKLYCSYAFYDEGKKVHEKVPFNKHLCGYAFTHGEGANNFYVYGDSIFTLFPFNDTIYTVKNDGDLNPYMAIKIGKEYICLDDDKKQVDKLRTEQEVSSIHAFYKWDKYLFFSYFYKDDPCKSVLVKDDCTILYHGSLVLDENLLPIHTVAYDTDNAERLLLSVIRPFEILPIAKDRTGKSIVWDELSGRISEEGNPILVFYEPIF